MRRILALVGIIWVVFGFSANVGAQVYVAYRAAGIVNKYDVDTGALVAERFIQGLAEPHDLCLDKGVLYVLQGNGTIGKYDAQTGAAINDHFITGFQMPQAMAVRDGVIYVTSFAWPFQNLQTIHGEPCLIGKYDASTGATINANLLQTDHLAGSIAVAGHDLFVADASPLNPNGPAVYDTTTGSPVPRNYQPMLNGAGAVTANDDWVWFTCGARSPDGYLFKYSATGDANGVQGFAMAYFHPLITNMNMPSVVAVSGEEVIVGSGSGTGLSKYNATTGDLIKADFISDRGDRFAGIAVVPRAAAGQYAVADATFTARNIWLGSVFWLSTNGTMLYSAAGILVLLVIVGLVIVYHYKSPEPGPELASGISSAPTLDATLAGETEIPAETLQEPLPDSAPVDESAHVIPAASPASVAPSPWGMALLGIFVFTLLFAGALVWFASQSVGISHPGTGSDLIGLWGVEPNDGGDNHMTAYHQAFVYPTHLDYSKGSGTIRLEGHWRDDGFWYTKPDGSGEVEVCHLKNPLELEIHLSTLTSNEQGDAVLYKERGSDEEMKSMADRYPAPITYPPPAGVIKFWMSEYELQNLPWHADRIEIHTEDPAYSRGKTYDYHSDNPQVGELQVVVKNHRVVKVIGGNG